ncbi:MULTISPECIES: hypothetical protein [Zhongshania]|uniref:Uncharacterized protein n=1 Tax=Zhongshania antarctica TaxID=641702 RepID=A0A840R507_9GAMM|nr:MULTISPECIES: hypothetical protein [Zhongshania]MBB5187897.1 hypothetical protein [Zhongshania antarctica]
MKNLTSAILILVASTMATAAEPEVGANQSLVLAYNKTAELQKADAPIEYASKASADRFLEKTLDVVSATLNVELDMQTRYTVPSIAKN